MDARGPVYPWAFLLGHCDMDVEHKHQRLDVIVHVAAACSVFIEGHNEKELKAVEENRQAGRRGTN